MKYFLSELQHDSNKRNGVIATLVFHTLLLLLALLLFGAGELEEEDEFEEISIQLALGDSDFGSGDAPPPPSKSNDITPEPVPEAAPATPQVVENFETQSAPSTMTISEEKEKEEPVEEKEEVDERLASALNAFQQPSKETGKGKGLDEQAGTVGKPDGHPDGKSNHGTRDGTGHSYKVGTRTLLTNPSMVSSHQQSGKIVVDIIVDRRGNVIKAKAGGQGTTITNGAELEKAEQEVMRQKFSPSKDGRQEQRGQITFFFKLQ